MDTRAEIRDFLTSRRARITPHDVGPPDLGGRRRVPGLRRSELATLAGISVDYLTSSSAGTSPGPPRSDAFATRWGKHNVRIHRTAAKRLHNPVIGELELTTPAPESHPQTGTRVAED